MPSKVKQMSKSPLKTTVETYIILTLLMTAYSSQLSNDEILDNEPIDVFIKSESFGDKETSYDDIRYTLRSIDKYMPWIRRIYLVVFRGDITFLKDDGELDGKYVVINNKDLISFDANSTFPYKFNVHKMRKFGLSENFIIMGDDYFIGGLLKKESFFYVKDRKVYPFLINKNFRLVPRANISVNLHQNEFNENPIYLDPHALGYSTLINRGNKLMSDYFNDEITVPDL